MNKHIYIYIDNIKLTEIKRSHYYAVVEYVTPEAPPAAAPPAARRPQAGLPAAPTRAAPDTPPISTDAIEQMLCLDNLSLSISLSLSLYIYIYINNRLVQTNVS